MPARNDNIRDDGGNPVPVNDTVNLIDTLYTFYTDALIKGGSGGQYHPIYHSPITKFRGIEASGNFITTDTSTKGAMSYVTVGRQASQPSVGGGLGFAWRKSSLIPETYDSDGFVETEQLSYNCYLVDNSMLSEKIFINAGNLITDGGVNNYIGGNNIAVYGRRTLLPNTLYQFKLKITSNYEMTVWILDDGLDLDLTEDVTYGADPNTGVPTNQYGWVLKRSSSDPAYSPNASGTNFGVSVLDTGNDEWRYSNLKIKSITEDFVVSMYKVDADPNYLVDGDPFHVYWRGWGQWDDGEADERGASIFIYNVTEEEWELIGRTTATLSSPEVDKVVSGSFDDISYYRDGNNYVTILASTSKASDTANINTVYVSVDNVTPSGIHTGGMLDIYVNSPTKIEVLDNSIVVPVGGAVLISEDNGFQLPFHSILAITSDVTGDELVLGDDYTLVVATSRNAWSTQPSLTLNFTTAPATVTVRYRYFSQGSDIQDFLSNSDNRNPGVDPLLKINAPTIITIPTLDYRGDIGADNLKVVIKDWVNAIDDALEVSDLINELYDNSVDYINLDTLSITRDTYDYLGNLLKQDEPITNSYTLSGLQAFYTDSYALYGVNKLG